MKALGPEIETKKFDANSKAHYALMQPLNDDDLTCIINCTSAYEVWQFLITTHEGTSQVKRVKIDLLCSQYENFRMHDNESIDDMVVGDILKALTSLY